MSSVVLPIRTPGQPPAPSRDTGRSIVRGIGEVFITLGVLLLLMCVYQLWWTNVESAKAIAVGRDEISADFRGGAPLAAAPADTAKPVARPAYGTGFALLYIPRLRDKVWGLPVYQGTGKDILAKGAGHYRSTAMPGDCPFVSLSSSAFSPSSKETSAKLSVGTVAAFAISCQSVALRDGAVNVRYA